MYLCRILRVFRASFFLKKTAPKNGFEILNLAFKYEWIEWNFLKYINILTLNWTAHDHECRTGFFLYLLKTDTTGQTNCIFCYKVFLLWRLPLLKSNLCGRQVYGWLTWWPEALTSFLAAALGTVCVLFLCSSRAVCARAVCECFQSHSANHTGSGEMRSGSWFLEEWTAAKPQTMRDS